MGNDPSKINKKLYPLAWTYGAVVSLRNKLFDCGILQSKSFRVPVICIGNLAVGGTGKTPHTEYIIRLLQDDYRVAVLSRGYKRKTKGFIRADQTATAEKIGDEPFQMFTKYPGIQVAVDEDRRDGITQLMKAADKPEVILLDDAFQHRYVKAGLNILLTDYHRMFCDDVMLPAGRLREPISGKDRANIVIVTKCPKDLVPIQYNIIRKKLALKPYQKLYFSTLYYGALKPLFSKADAQQVPVNLQGKQILLVTGIAYPAPLQEELERQGARIDLFAFGDHHSFSKKDISDIVSRLQQMPKGSILVTTEKDATRLVHRKDIPSAIQEKMYVMPIEVGILQERKTSFNKAIISYVRENQ